MLDDTDAVRKQLAVHSARGDTRARALLDSLVAAAAPRKRPAAVPARSGDDDRGTGVMALPLDLLKRVFVALDDDGKRTLAATHPIIALALFWVYNDDVTVKRSTVLEYAMARSYREGVQHVLDNNKFDRFEMQNAAMSAVRRGLVGVIPLFHDYVGVRHLRVAVNVGSLATVKALLDEGAESSPFRTGSTKEWSPLLKAVHDGRGDIARLILSRGGGPVGERGYAMVGYAIKNGDADLAQMLFDIGMRDVRARDRS